MKEKHMIWMLYALMIIWGASWIWTIVTYTMTAIGFGRDYTIYQIIAPPVVVITSVIVFGVIAIMIKKYKGKVD